jgi:hypothetical protein
MAINQNQTASVGIHPSEEMSLIIDSSDLTVSTILLGRGKFGAVYQATYYQPGRFGPAKEVAVKQFYASTDDDTIAVLEFVEKATVLFGLSHQNIIKVYAR